MIDYHRRGAHVRIIGHPHTFTHQFTGSETGIVLGETDNGLGQMLASIDWDGPEDFGPIFSDEIQEIEAGH